MLDGSICECSTPPCSFPSICEHLDLSEAYLLDQKLPRPHGSRGGSFRAVCIPMGCCPDFLNTIGCFADFLCSWSEISILPVQNHFACASRAVCRFCGDIKKSRFCMGSCQSEKSRMGHLMPFPPFPPKSMLDLRITSFPRQREDPCRACESASSPGTRNVARQSPAART